MSDEEISTSFEIADELRRLISTRVGCRPGELSCPHAMSRHTPCVARDGALAVAEGEPADVCVGCDTPISTLMTRELARN